MSLDVEPALLRDPDSTLRALWQDLVF
jgi:hypothetical protein